MISLGIICYQGHSSAAALVRDGIVIGAVSEERFTRKKSDDSFPENAIHYLLQEYNLTFLDIHHVAVGWSPGKTVLGQITGLHKKSLSFLFEKRAGGIVRSRIEKFFLISNIKNEFKKRYDYSGKFSYVDHHVSHAISAFVQSEKKDCIVMVADGMGELASTTIYEFKNNTYTIHYQDTFPHSLGIFYSTATQFLGFIPDSDEYKVMGMAAYSQNEKFDERFSKLYFFENNHLRLNLNYFQIHKKANQFFSPEFAELFPDVLSEEDKTSFAYSLQSHLNKMVGEILKRNSSLFTSKNFAASGGVFLNCLLNQHLRSSELFNSYTFFPVADDNGTAVGCAQFVQMNGKVKMQKLHSLSLGPEAGILSKSELDGLKSRKTNVSEIAALLAEGNVIGLVQGRMEFGHRSLGNRSILASPQKKSMKETINKKIKLREPFRPFAPAILQDKVSDYFEGEGDFPFMIETLNALAWTKEKAPAIVHEDGTSRIQTVTQKENAYLYSLLFEFNELTQCPILLNTSFNINGMPIVCSAKDAIACFKQTQLDFLVVEDLLIWK
jgi:carbamoyltransferase